MISKQNEWIAEMKADQKIFKEQLSKLQATAENQNTIIVEMLAGRYGIESARKNITTITSEFPLKTEEDLKKMDSEISDVNIEKYVSAVEYLLDGNVLKNFERIISRGLCMLYNTDGICGKKSFKSHKNIYKIIIDAISHNSSNPEKEMRSAFQVVKKRHFRLNTSRKKENKPH